MLWAMLTMSCAMYAQTWTWTGETWKDASTRYYLRQPSGDRYVTGDNKIVDNINSAALWTISGTSGATIQAVGGQKIHNEDQTWTLNGTTVDGSQAYSFTTQVRVVFSINTYYVYISSNAINTTTSDNTASATKNWYLISEAQVTARDNYVAAYNNAVKVKVAENILNENNSANSSNVTSKIEALENAVAAKLASVNNENPLDLSSLIINPDANDGSNGWTGDNGIHSENAESDGAFFEPAGWWKQSATISQTVTGLPNGYYALQMRYQAHESVTVTLSGNTSSKSVIGTNEGWNVFNVYCKVTDGTLAINASSLSTRTDITWFNCDNFTLTYLGAEDTYTYTLGSPLNGNKVSLPAAGVDPGHENDALLVFTWRGSETTNPYAALQLMSGAKATVDGEEVDLIQSFRTSNYHDGFALYIPNYTGTARTIVVPAGVFGYLGTSAVNERIELTTEQAPLADGKYFITVDGTGKHVSRGKGWGTQAILDYYGVPVLVQTAGLTVFKFIDNGLFLGSNHSDDWLYSDVSGDDTRRYEMSAGSNGGYTFYTPARNKYIFHEDDMMKEKEDSGDEFHFEAINDAEYAKHLATILSDEKMRIAAKAGITVADAAGFDDIVAEFESNKSNISLTDVQKQNAIAEAYQIGTDNAWDAQPKKIFTQTLSGLENGLYRVTVNAFQRATWLDVVYNNCGFRGLAYLYANDAKEQLMSLTEYNFTENKNENCLEQGSKWYANGLTSAETAFADNQYVNVVYTYVTNGTLEYGIVNPRRNNAGEWIAYQNFKVEKLGTLDEANMTVAAGKYGTFVAPFNVKMPEGVTAYSAEVPVGGGEVTLTAIASPGEILEAGNPVILLNDGSENVSTIFRGDANGATGTVDKNGLVGFYISGGNIPAGNYVLQTQNDKQAFYRVSEEKPMTGKGVANRCYLKENTNAGAAARLTIGFGTATSIDNVQFNVINNDAVRYNLNGQRVNANAKGIVIVNGKKVVLR